MPVSPIQRVPNPILTAPVRGVIGRKALRALPMSWSFTCDGAHDFEYFVRWVFDREFKGDASFRVSKTDWHGLVDEHTVGHRKKDGKLQCDCRAGAQHRECRHVLMVQQVVEDIEQRGTRVV